MSSYLRDRLRDWLWDLLSDPDESADLPDVGDDHVSLLQRVDELETLFTDLFNAAALQQQTHGELVKDLGAIRRQVSALVTVMARKAPARDVVWTWDGKSQEVKS